MEKKPDLIKFLLGIEDYNGLWFGDIDNNGQRFWWRTLLKEEFDSLQSQLSEAEKRIKELEEISADDDHAILILEDQLKTSQSQNERLLSALKEIVSCQYDPEKSLANLNGAIRDAKQLINEIEKQ